VGNGFGFLPGRRHLNCHQVGRESPIFTPFAATRARVGRIDTDARPARSPTEFEASIDFRIGWRFWHWGAVTQTHQFFICGSFIVANRFPRVLQRSSIKRPLLNCHVG
jgi:hypothetical protein